MEAPSSLPGVAVLTGAASGLARATAKTFVLNGCTKLALLDIDEAGLEETKNILHSVKQVDVKTYRVDVSDASSIESAFTQIHKDFNRIDYCVLAAGIIVEPLPSTELSIESFDKLTEAYPEANIPPVRSQRGAIVNFSSGLGILAMPLAPAYNGSKAGIMALTKSDTLDYADYKIRINAVLPGIFDTPITNKTPEQRAALLAGCTKWSSAKRLGVPEEIADITVFLCSNEASFIYGADIAVDGGWLAGKIG